MAADRQPKMRAMIMAAQRGRAPRRAGRAAAAAAGRLRGPVRGDARQADHDPPARPAAARVPARPRRARAARAEGARRGARRSWPRSSRSSTSCCGSARSTRCSARAAAGSGIVHPEIYEMQVEAIMRAARAAAAPPRLEIMIPLVDFEAELVELRAMVDRGSASATACARARTTSWHDDRAAARVLHRRPARRRGGVLLVRDQRPHPDRARLLARRRRGRLRAGLPRAPHPRPLAVRDDRRRRRRRARRDWPSGSGARGARASSSASAASTAATPTRSRSSTRAGLDYVSCSPFRLPIARVAAAQAALAADERAIGSRYGEQDT